MFLPFHAKSEIQKACKACLPAGQVMPHNAAAKPECCKGCKPLKLVCNYSQLG